MLSLHYLYLMMMMYSLVNDFDEILIIQQQLQQHVQLHVHLPKHHLHSKLNSVTK